MKKLLAISLAATMLGGLPAAAQTYDAFSSFNGTANGGAFTYGVFNGTSFTAYNDTPGCAALISDVICTSNGNLPAAFKTTSGAHPSGTVLVPADALILHPGPDAGQASAVLFTAPLTSAYNVSFSASIADTNPTGVNIELFGPGFPPMTLATLTGVNRTFSLSEPVGFVVPAGTQFGFAVDYDGLYYDDSTAIKFTATAVPEPATWAMMLVGFGMVGFGLRYRRKSAKVSVA